MGGPVMLEMLTSAGVHGFSIARGILLAVCTAGVLTVLVFIFKEITILSYASSRREIVRHAAAMVILMLSGLIFTAIGTPVANSLPQDSDTVIGALIGSLGIVKYIQHQWHKVKTKQENQLKT